MWSMRANTRPSVPSGAVRIALAANRAAGGGLDPAALARAMPAEVLIVGIGELERAVEWAPDRLAVAGGGGTNAPLAAPGRPPGGPPARPPPGAPHPPPR